MSLVNFFLGSPVIIACVMVALIASGALLFITSSLKFDARQYQRLGDKPSTDSNKENYGLGDQS